MLQLLTRNPGVEFEVSDSESDQTSPDSSSKCKPVTVLVCVMMNGNYYQTGHHYVTYTWFLGMRMPRLLSKR